MELELAIKNRRAQYPAQFSGETVDREVLEAMLEMANWAPTHKHTEPWRFKVFEDKAKDRLITAMMETYVLHTPAESYDPLTIEKWEQRKAKISHIIAIIMKRHEKAGIPETEEIASVAMAVQNMWLYLAGIEDVGGYWSTPGMIFEKSFEPQLQLEQDEKCLGIFIMGKIAPNAIPPSGKRKPWQEKVDWYKI